MQVLIFSLFFQKRSKFRKIHKLFNSVFSNNCLPLGRKDGFFWPNSIQTISGTYGSNQKNQIPDWTTWLNQIARGDLPYPKTWTWTWNFELWLISILTHSREESWNIEFQKVHSICFPMVYSMSTFLKNWGQIFFTKISPMSHFGIPVLEPCHK